MGRFKGREYLLAAVGLAATTLGFLAMWRFAGRIGQVLALVAIIEGALLVAYAAGVIWTRHSVRLSMVAEMERKLAEGERNLSKRVEELSILHEISLAASSGIGIDDVLARAAAATEKTLPYVDVGFFVVDGERKRLSVRAGYGASYEAAKESDLAVGEGITGRVVASGETLNVPDVAADVRYVKTIETTASELCVPMRLGERVIGGINVESPERNAFDEDDERFLATLAGQLAVLLEHARLFEQEKQRSVQLAALQTTTQMMTAELDRRPLLDTMVQVARQVFASQASSVYVWDDKGDNLHISASSGLSEAYAAQQRIVRERLLELLPRESWRPVTLSGGDLQKLTSHPELVEAEGLTGALLIPLAAGNDLLGALIVSVKEGERHFTAQDIELAQIFAGQAVVSLENARLFAEASKASEMLALQRIASTISSSLDLKEVLGTVMTVTSEVVECQKTAIFDVDESAGSLRLVIAHGLSETFRRGCEHLDVEQKQRGAAALGHAVLVEDIESDPEFSAFAPLARAEGFRAFADVPMRSKGKVIGVLSAYYAQPHVFAQSEIELLTAVANQAAVATENARLYSHTDADLRRRVDELMTLRQISLRLVSSLDVDTVLDLIAESTLRLIHATDVYIFLYDEAHKTFISGSALSAGGERASRVMSPEPNGITLDAVRQRRPIVIDNAAAHPVYSQLEAAVWGIRAMASFPLLRAQTVVGAFNVIFLEPHTFSEDELRVLTLLADQAAIAVENARLLQKLAEQTKRDSLTQVFNHGALLEELRGGIAEAEKKKGALSFIMLDIDYFKEYNDRYGHVVGDQVLKAIVQSITANVKRTDIVGRWGGEEFSILLPGATVAQAKMVAQRTRETIAHLHLEAPDGQLMPNPTVSQGVAAFPLNAASADELIDVADRALYQAKAAGRDQVVIAGE